MVSVSNSRLNLSKIKCKPSSIDIIEGINKLHNSVLTKACVLNGIIKDKSIGPDCSNSYGDDYVDSSPAESFATSTPDQSINGCTDNNGFHNSVETILSSSKGLEQIDKPDKGTPCSSKAVNGNSDNCLQRFSQKKKLYDSTRLQQYEKERKDVVTMKVKQKVQLLVKEELKIKEELDEIKQESQLARARLELERTQKLLREEEDRTNEAQLWKFYNEQRCNQRLNEANERIKKALQKQQEAEERQRQHLKEKKIRLDKIHEYQIIYRTAYQQLQEITKSCKNNKALFTAMSNEAVHLKAANERFEVIVEKCKTGHVTLEDIADCADIIKTIKGILDLFRKEVEAVNLRHDNAAKKEEEKLKEAAKVNSQTEEVAINDFVDKESLENHQKLKQFLEEYEASLQPLVNDESAKKFRFSCQRAINIPVNAISPISREHMQDKYIRLSKLLKGQPVLVSNTTVSASSHPLGIKFCTNLLAKKFVNQGEHTVSSKPEAAFAIAGIIVSLWLEFPDFGKLLLAHFQMECPYLIPMYIPQLEGQSNEDYYRVLGYQYIDGKVESQDKFLKRMSGIMHLYAAILITQPQIRNVPHPLGLREGWRWLAATLNLEPRVDITATLILDLLEVAGNELWKCYRCQFIKLLHFICSDFFKRIEKVLSLLSYCYLSF